MTHFFFSLPERCLMFVLLVTVTCFTDLKAQTEQTGYQSGLEVARNKIDHQLTFEEAQKDYKVWYSKALIYKDLYVLNPALEADSSYRTIAMNAVLKSISLDKKKVLEEDNSILAKYLSNTYFNDAKAAFDKEQYNKATALFLEYYDKTKQVDEKLVDPNTLFYIGYNAFLANDSTVAKEYLTKSIKVRNAQPLAYVALSKIELNIGDTVNAVNYLDQGMKLFAENKDLNIAKANLMLQTKHYAAALPLLEKVVKLDSTDTEVLVVTGSTLEKLAETDSLDQTKMERALQYYEKALMTDQNHFVANYNIGTLLYNRAVAESTPKTRSTILDQLLLRKEVKNSRASFKEALPYLEKASNIDPTHREALVALKAIYGKLNDDSKQQATADKIKRLDELERKVSPISQSEKSAE